MKLSKKSWRWVRRAGCIAVLLTVLVGLIAFGWQRYEASFDVTSEARLIAESVAVSGFTQTVVVDIIDSNSSYATAYFIGPSPKPDPLAIITVPTIALSASTPRRKSPYLDPPSHEVVARGQRSDGCYATVAFDTNPRLSNKAVPPVQLLTAEQQTAVRSGSQVFIEVHIGDCGWK